MDYSEYLKLYNNLNRPEDMKKFLDQGYDARLLGTLYTQKVSRCVKKNYGRIARHSRDMLRSWNKGKSICEIADFYDFPPMLTAMLIFREDGTGKKAFWTYVRDPSLLESPQTARELTEAAERDLVYSPQANEVQKERGQWGERLLWNWLDAQGVEYKTEDDERGEDGYVGGKTPDCLLACPMEFEGKKICWIESKASFGDDIEFRYNRAHQLIPYTELFGPGMVIYWTGHLDELKSPDPAIILEDIGILQKQLKPWHGDEDQTE
ncbi:MAG: C15orf41 family protein [Candidatus Methanomethylophilus sp.]|nr:C15orf41 family protein [Methanomethylophilus sp.]MDD3232724.1 C15orf41 family protein [Methanomethylophilus sp.]MDD4221743.1 C15orf41 family protein [Methanomethylophilus sp.]MDD4668409.1 C15orf41 family protein [Methanomethylophilus sp.]